MTNKTVDFDDMPVTLEIKAEPDSSLSPFDDEATEEFTNVTSKVTEAYTHLAFWEKRVLDEFAQTDIPFPREVSMTQSAHGLYLNEHIGTLVNATYGKDAKSSKTYFIRVLDPEKVQIWDSRQGLAKLGPLELILSWKEVNNLSVSPNNSLIAEPKMEMRRGYLEKGWHAILPFKSLDEQKNVHGPRATWLDLRHTYHSIKGK